MENEKSKVSVSTWKASYAGEAGHTFRRVQCGAFVAIAISYPARTDRYICEVYTVDAHGCESFLGYEIAVCVHPGDMARAISEARPNWAEQSHHLAVG